MINKTQPAKPEGLLPFNRRRIIEHAICEYDYLNRWIDDEFTPRKNRIMFTARLPQARVDRDRALALKAKLPPEWTGPKQPSML